MADVFPHEMPLKKSVGENAKILRLTDAKRNTNRPRSSLPFDAKDSRHVSNKLTIKATSFGAQQSTKQFMSSPESLIETSRQVENAPVNNLFLPVTRETKIKNKISQMKSNMQERTLTNTPPYTPEMPKRPVSAREPLEIKITKKTLSSSLEKIEDGVVDISQLPLLKKSLRRNQPALTTHSKLFAVKPLSNLQVTELRTSLSNNFKSFVGNEFQKEELIVADSNERVMNEEGEMDLNHAYATLLNTKDLFDLNLQDDVSIDDKQEIVLDESSSLRKLSSASAVTINSTANRFVESTVSQSVEIPHNHSKSILSNEPDLHLVTDNISQNISRLTVDVVHDDISDDEDSDNENAQIDKELRLFINKNNIVLANNTASSKNATLNDTNRKSKLSNHLAVARSTDELLLSVNNSRTVHQHQNFVVVAKSFSLPQLTIPKK